MPESAIRFWTYDYVKKLVCRDPRCPSLPERLLAGAAAGFASCLAIYPLEVTKTRMAVAKQARPRSQHATRQPLATPPQHAT